ncbi:MAG TPA: metallophosphoesterase [Paracoccus sp. (in: a-proteobacteria)]|uniref:metallophosphoesterase n=1 Tax=uncultured Paracoccus sp. TaxID=189685 RepID=UPI00260ED292|nr:metallophosphoesterase [uncultured Paracoccus sp.]HMQ40193.1 metallophosphoesterase [Paracoccus sp. (in: a-proteobacteria)]HMR37335.1 metallophosphoesterase [Paracoccus sp. (in: a-proteobacteria)]
MTHWYTADLHFCDEGIMRYFGRPFRSITEMNNAMIDGIVARLREGDDLWVLGDVADTGAGGEELARTLIERLPGRAHLVRGNHDDTRVTALPWTSQHELIELRDGPECFVLCHYPLLSWNGARQGAIQLFGHVHDRWPGSDRQVNVGVDLWGFRPVTGTEAVIRAAGQKPLKVADWIGGVG